MTVAEIMNPSIVALSPDEPVSYAARVMARYNIGSVPVANCNGKLRGIVTDRDIVTRCIAAENDPNLIPVSDIMTKNAVTVQSDDDVRRASHLMALSQVRRLPVIKGESLVGMVSLGDISIHHDYDMEAAKALSEISSNIHRI
jgi:CBS domain-containing protein